MKRSEKTSAARRSDPLAALTQARILDDLQGALRLARSRRADRDEQLCEALSDLLTRVRAAAAARTTGEPEAAPAGAVSVVAMSLLARAGEGEPAAAFLLIPFGPVGVERPISGGSFEFTRAHAEAAQRWFETIGRKLAIDYEHQSFDRLNTRADGLRPAAGWIGRLEVRGDGLWAVDVEWTDKAQALLKSGEYRYFSPVIFWKAAERRELAGLGPVALTNDPAMHGVAALAAGRAAEDADDGDAEADADAEGGELAELQEEIGVLRREIARQEADTFVERGLRVGKIVEATSMDWREDYLRDPQATVSRLERAPVLLPPGRVLGRGGAGLAGGAPAVDERLRRLGIEAADLAAYEQAHARGRVRRYGES